SWKARLEGYEEAIKLFVTQTSDKSPIFNEYLGLIKKAVVDSNAVAQDKSLDMVLTYLTNAACAPKLFGAKVIPIKNFIKSLLKLLDDRDPSIRNEVKCLIIEIYRWIGSAIKPQLSILRPVVLNELEAEFTAISLSKPVPERYLKSQRPKDIPQAADVGCSGPFTNETSNANNMDTGEVMAFDPYEMADPVDMLSKIPSDFYEKLNEKKWQDRRDAMECIEKLTNVVRLAQGDYSDLIKALLKVISKDTNVMLVALAAKIVCHIARGLRKKFSPYAAHTIHVCLDKFKEKKSNVVLSLREAVDISVKVCCDILYLTYD
ncbi:unnamed protein product, partial [Protopolystoma xenopodis]